MNQNYVFGNNQHQDSSYIGGNMNDHTNDQLTKILFGHKNAMMECNDVFSWDDENQNVLNVKKDCKIKFRHKVDVQQNTRNTPNSQYTQYTQYNENKQKTQVQARTSNDDRQTKQKMYMDTIESTLGDHDYDVQLDEGTTITARENGSSAIKASAAAMENSKRRKDTKNTKNTNKRKRKTFEERYLQPDPECEKKKFWREFHEHNVKFQKDMAEFLALK